MQICQSVIFVVSYSGFRAQEPAPVACLGLQAEVRDMLHIATFMAD